MFPPNLKKMKSMMLKRKKKLVLDQLPRVKRKQSSNKRLMKQRLLKRMKQKKRRLIHKRT